MPTIQWRSGPTPVTISALATGVTEGKLDTQSGTSTPRRRSLAKVGALPSLTASSSMSVRIEST
jgi:hypothetical protein